MEILRGCGKGETVIKLQFASEGVQEQGNSLNFLNTHSCQFPPVREDSGSERTLTEIVVNLEDWVFESRKEKELGLDSSFVPE